MRKKVTKAHTIHGIMINNRACSATFHVNVFIEDGELEEGGIIIKAITVMLRNGHKRILTPDSKTYKLVCDYIADILDGLLYDIINNNA